tara:strand:+ start:175 stop:864 length:690 start_codon:yes stop_codon:yes gene_type:complete
MKIHCCSFASENFAFKQNIQKKYFLAAGFKNEEIHLLNPEKLGNHFYKNQPNASENNKFGWFTFKPYSLLSTLEIIEEGDILLYMDVNDKPLKGIKEYLEYQFLNKKVDLLAPSTNYFNIKFLSLFHRSNLSPELIFSSYFNFQPEAGAIAIRKSTKSKFILWTWYYLTLINSHELDKNYPQKTRHDQETLFILSRIYKSIKLESWFIYKISRKGIRRFIDFEKLRDQF